MLLDEAPYKVTKCTVHQLNTRSLSPFVTRGRSTFTDRPFCKTLEIFWTFSMEILRMPLIDDSLKYFERNFESETIAIHGFYARAEHSSARRHLGL